MDGFRSRSYADDRMQIEVYGRTATHPPPPPLRSYSTSYTSSSSYEYSDYVPREVKKAKSSKKGWVLGDAEFQRKKRVASYKAYSVEGKVKGSFRKSFRWLKDRYYDVVYGWW
ncbi:uncharacterized protein [Typha angustifolia]|uniref:uncharacterized protein n=1 Tax=Typha angustifolia TaxID=59011 RepID=UPI003C2DD046